MGEYMEGGLLDALAHWTSRQPDKPLFTFLGDEGNPRRAVTYAECAASTDRLAAALLADRRLSLRRGDRVLLVFPPSVDFILAFLACLKAGLVAVPVFPPDPNKLKRDLHMFATVQASCGAAVALTCTTYNYALKMSAIRGIFQGRVSWPDLRWLETDAILFGGEAPPRGNKMPPAPNSEDLAFLQFTSGSTSSPKGVMISHANLAHNLSLIVAGLSAKDDTVVVSWLPQYHDMGLIGSYLGCLYCGGSGYYLSPIAFIRNPPLWMECASRYRATHMQAPNFAYGLTARKFAIARARRDGEPLDLSSVRHMINGAEPVDPATVDKFYAVFEPYGLRRGAVFPTYGLAEHCVYVSSNGSVRLTVDREALEGDRVVREVDKLMLWTYSDGEGGRGGADEGTRVTVLAGCGRPADGTGVDLRIVDVEVDGEGAATALPEGRVGEIWVSSPSCAGGYWGLHEETREAFGARLADGSGPFLRTGDLGFLHGGELFVCGRAKDLIIVRGRNHYPQDIERACEAACPDLLRPGCSAAVGVPALGGGERVVYVAELREGAGQGDEGDAVAAAAQAVEACRHAASVQHGVSLTAVHVMPPRTVPKTTSGKISRQRCRSMLLEGRLEAMHVWADMDTRVPGAGAVDGAGDDMAVAAEGDGRELDEDAVDPTEMDEAEVLERLRAEVARVMKVDPTSLPEDAPLSALGLDSMAGAELACALERRFTTALPEELLGEPDATLRVLAGVLRGGARAAAAYRYRPTLLSTYELFGRARELSLKRRLRVDERSRRELWSGLETKPPLGGDMRLPEGAGAEVAPMDPWDELYIGVWWAVVLGAFFWLPAVALLSLGFVPMGHAAAFWATFVLVAYLTPPRSCWPIAFRYSRLSANALRYFSYRTIHEVPLSDYGGKKPVIMAAGPHGVLPFGNILQILASEAIFGFSFHGLAASIVLQFPIYGTCARLLGIRDVSRKSIERLLGRERHSVGIVPGGIREMFAMVDAKADEEVLCMRSRAGLVKVALRTGAQLVPCFIFGNSRVLSCFQSKTLSELSRSIRATITFFWGRYGLPVPYRVPLLGVMGIPLECPQVDNPSPELVHEYHEAWIREVQRIFEKYKHVYGWGHMRLVIK